MKLPLESTITGGIQDISALLPLLGTEQCEDHVSSSLIGGFLYAAATPLSIFGSLGLVSAGLKVLAASVVIKFCGKVVLGAKKLSDIGLESSGTVLSQIMWNGDRHVAERQLEETLEELHIADVKNLTVDANCWTWNMRMLATSLIALILSITPYIFLIENNIGDKLFLRWLFPLSRSIGSLIISNMLQILVQIRLLQIIKHRIIFLTLDAVARGQNIDFRSSFDWWDSRSSSEAVLYRLETCSMPTEQDDNSMIPSRPGDEENPKPLPEQLNTTADEAHRKLLRLLPEFEALKKKHFFATTRFRHMTLAAQILITCGIVLTIVGYIGCFSLVQSSSSTSLAPLIWLLAEIALSLVRMGLWAWNPTWDEKQTYLTFTLGLARHSPLSTCDMFYEDLEVEKDIPLTPSVQFLGDITSFVGSLEPPEVPDGIALYYTMTRRKSDGQRVLYATTINYRVNTSWTLVYPSRLSSPIDRRVAKVHLKDGDISTVWAEIGAALSTNDKETPADREFVEKLKSHCESILQKLRAHTFLEALVQAPAEVLEKKTWEDLKRALADGYQAGLKQAEEQGEIPPKLESKLESRLVDAMVDAIADVGQKQVPRLHTQAIQLRKTLSQAQILNQTQSRSQDPAQVLKALSALEEAIGHAAKQAVALRNTLRQALGLEQGQAVPTEPADAALAEVVMLGLLLAERISKKEGRELAEVMTEVAAEVMALGRSVEQVHKTLDGALWLALLLKQAIRDRHVMMEIRKEVQTEVRMRVSVRRLLQGDSQGQALEQALEQARERWGEELTQPLEQTLYQTQPQRWEKDSPLTTLWEALNPADAPQTVVARTLARAQELEQEQEPKRAPTQTQMRTANAQRPPLKIKLTWELKSREEIAQMEWTKANRYHRRPWTDDDQDDMTYLGLGELESHTQQICLRRYEWSKEMYSIARESLPDIAQNAEARIGQTSYTISGAAIVEIYVLDGVQDMERMLIAESSELENILMLRVKATVSALQQRRTEGEENARLRKKIIDEQKVNAMCRVVKEAARVQERLEGLRKEAHTRIREANHSAQTMTLLESQWRRLQNSIVDVWVQLGRTIDQGSETPSINTSRKPIDLLPPELKTWLEVERERIKARLRRASNLAYVGLLNEHRHSRTSTFLVRRLLSKNSKLIRFHSDEENGFGVNPTTQRCSSIVSWVDCTTSTLDEVTKIMCSSWKERGVTLILPKERLKISDLTPALGSSQNDHVLFFDFPDAPVALDRVDEDTSATGNDVLVPNHHDGTFAYYQCVVIDDDSSYLVFKRPGESRCTVSFSVSAKDIASDAMSGPIKIRLVHCRTNSNGKLDIHLNRTYRVAWDEDNCPQSDFGTQDIVVPRGTLRPGVNTFTITLRNRGEDASEAVYQMKDVQLVWPRDREESDGETESDRENESEGWRVWDD